MEGETRNSFQFSERVRRSLVELNLFETGSEDQTIISIERWSTRVYILLLSLGMFTLLIYNGLSVERREIEIINPSMETYLKLWNAYGDANVRCPCTRISSSYGSFVEVTPTYYDICTSFFVSQQWIDALFDNITSMRYFLDFRLVGSLQFQALRELCSFSQIIMNSDIEEFYNEEYISGYLQNENIVSAEIEATIENFRSNSKTEFLQLFTFLRILTYGNQYWSGIQTNLVFVIIPWDGLTWNTVVSSVPFPNPDDTACWCYVSGYCPTPAAFYPDVFPDTQASIVRINRSATLENWFIGCWPLESLLSSSIDKSFLNNQTALNMVLMYFNKMSLTNSVTPIAVNESAGMSQGGSFMNLLQNTMFVKQLTTKFNYSLYFTQCGAKSCFYTIKQRNSVLYIFTSFFGLYGGLSVILRLLVPRVTIFLIQRLIKRSTTQVSVNSDQTTVRVVKSKERVQKMVLSVWHSLIDMNLFKSLSRQQPHDIKRQRWTTWIYICSLGLSLFILIIYTTVNVETKSIEIKSPPISTVEQLQAESSAGSISSLQCPCTQLTVPYGVFIQLQPTYHQVCSSDFVSTGWMNALGDSNAAGDVKYSWDFSYARLVFQLLKTLCVLSNETIVNSLKNFQQTQLITTQLLMHHQFSVQLSSIVNEFKLQTINNFLSFLNLQRSIMFMNQIASGVAKNFRMSFIDITNPKPYFTIKGLISSNFTCSCANDSNCKIMAAVYKRENNTFYPVYYVPGFYTTCFVTEALMLSNLECFYDDQSCLDDLIKVYNAPRLNATRFSSSSNSSRFPRDTTMGQLLSELFIEYWQNTSSYSSYFEQCRPASCTYKISRRNSAIETITRVVALIGGLFVSLRIIVILLVTILFHILHRRCERETVELGYSSLRRLHVQFSGWIKQLNVFDKIKNRNTIEQQRRSTRIYLVLISISLVVLVLNNWLVYSSKTFTVSNPSFEQYQQLQQHYEQNALSCPCSQLSISYSSFVEIEYDIHQVCESQFVSNSYIQQLFQIYNQLNASDVSMNIFTLQGTIFTHYQALSILCNQTIDAVSNVLEQFLSSFVISAYMADSDFFYKQTNASLSKFQSTLPDSFLNSLKLLRGMIQGNGLVSAYSTNWYHKMHNLNSMSTVYLYPQFYGNCSCATSATCVQPSIPFIPGYLVGCTPLEALLQSTIECLYEQSCLDFLKMSLNMSSSSSIIPLNKSTTQFAINQSIESIIQEMFVESWSYNISYNNFFEQCQPLSCYVTVSEQNGILIGITTILGLYGGLTTFFKLVVPLCVWFGEKLFKRFRRRTQVTVEPTDVSHS